MSVIEVLYGPDGKTVAKMVVDELQRMGHEALPLDFDGEKNYSQPQQPQYSIAILTNWLAVHIIGCNRFGNIWRNSKAKDLLYIWSDLSTTFAANHLPWSNHEPGIVLTSRDDEGLRSQIRDGIEYLTKTCDRCGKLCRNGYTDYVDSKTGNITKTHCRTCVREISLADYQKTDNLTTKLVIDAAIDDARKKLLPKLYRLRIRSQTKHVEEAIKSYEKTVWFPYAQQYYQRSTKRGHKLTVNGNVEVLMWGSAGRVMTTIQNNKTGSFISMLCSEDGSRSTMGLHGIDATSDEAIQMLQSVAEAVSTGAGFEAREEVTHIAVAMSQAS